MKAVLISPWKNVWVPYYKQAFEAKGYDFTHCPDESSARVLNPEIVLHGWCTTQPISEAKNVMFLRRYEVFSGGLRRIDWKNVDTLICVNTWIKHLLEETFREHGIQVPVKLIYNGLDVNKWKFRDRKHGKKIGMACHVHPKKNLPLAVQILNLLPENYTLHIAGEIQDPCTAEYLNHLGTALRRKIYLYGHVDDLDFWWEQHNYCLSTSISEGNPNNVIEAMAKGIKPIVHNWPGSEDQFETTFNTPEMAARMITEPDYDSRHYKMQVEKKYSLENIRKVVDLCVSP